MLFGHVFVMDFAQVELHGLSKRLSSRWSFFNICNQVAAGRVRVVSDSDHDILQNSEYNCLSFGLALGVVQLHDCFCDLIRAVNILFEISA
jgi:hypothetical protein